MRAQSLAAAAVVAVLTGAGLTLPLAGSASAASALPDDFNGDGYADLAVGTPHSNSVTVTFGSSSGVSPSRSVTVTQDTKGVPGVAEPEDEFGENVHSGDVNGDGYADLIVGAPGELVTGEAGGSVTIVWGGAKGLTTGGMVLNAPSDSDERFGEDTAFADLDGDGGGQLAVISGNHWWWYGDGTPETALAPEVEFLPVGVKLEGMQAGNFTSRDNATYVMYGKRADGGDYVGYVKGGPGDIGYHSGVLAEGTATGATHEAATAGDVDGDGYTDLVTGNASRNSLTVHYGGSGDFGSAATYDQNSAVVPGADEPEDLFGSALSAGDLDGDGYADVAVGLPGEKVGDVAETGSVVVLKGAKSGLTDGRAYHQETSGVAGVAEPGDHFGSSLSFRDINGNDRADLAIGARGEDIGSGSAAVADAGAVWVLRGASPYLTTASATSFNGTDFGLGTKGAEFGAVLH